MKNIACVEINISLMPSASFGSSGVIFATISKMPLQTFIQFLKKTSTKARHVHISNNRLVLTV